MRTVLSLLIAGAVAGSLAFGDPPSRNVNALIHQLGSPKFKEREAATALLDRLGADALPALQEALGNSDPEVRQRATLLAQKIEQRLQVEQLLGAKKIHLVYREVGVVDALNDFSAKAGIAIEVEGDRLGLRGRTVSMDTGEVPFWEALDHFCHKARLCERSSASNSEMLALRYGTADGEGVLVAPVDRSTGQQRLPRLVLEDAKEQQPLPTTYLGALRLRAVPPMVPRGAGGAAKDPHPAFVGFILDVTPEPKVPFQGILSLRIGKAVDDRGQTLQPPAFESAALAGDPLAGQILFDGVTGKSLPPVFDGRQAVARLHPGEKPAAMLKELQGTLTVNLIAMRKLVVVEEPLKAGGKDFKAADGTVLTVVETGLQDQSAVIRVHLASSPAAVQAGNGIRLIKGNSGSIVIEGMGQEAVFMLAAGTAKPVAPSKTEISLELNGKGGVDVQYVLRFARPSEQNAPLHLTYSAPRLMTVDIPFTLRDVPLVENPQQPIRVVPVTK